MASYNTYNGWKLRGRQVMEGERGHFRNKYGDMMFSRDQTVRKLKDDYELVMVRRCKYTGRFI